MLNDIVQKLYAERPQKTLFHYTSLSGLMGIVSHRAFWVSDIRYLNDAEELRHIGAWLDSEIARRLEASSGPQKLLTQFREWLRERLNYGPMLFVGCFTENGNLLSQWRGYCPHGRGVSIGFRINNIIEATIRSAFMIGKCVYDKETKIIIANEIIDTVISYSEKCGESSDYHQSQSYHGAFYKIEPDLLRIAALIKDQSFHEEAEWRVVSQVLDNYVEPNINFRDGPNMLIPYMELPLTNSDNKLEIECVFVGPTPTVNLSIDSLMRYLSREAVCSTIHNSGIPYRK